MPRSGQHILNRFINLELVLKSVFSRRLDSVFAHHVFQEFR